MRSCNNAFKIIMIFIVGLILGNSIVSTIESYEPKILLSDYNYITVVGDKYAVDEFFNDPDIITAIPVIFFTLLFGFLPVIFQIVFWTIIIKVIINGFRRSSNHRYFKNNVVSNGVYDNEVSKRKANKYVDVNDLKLEKFKTDNLDSLKQLVYDNFVRFETAYNNLDYNTMKILSTKQLYNNYHTGITLDLKIGKKRIIENIQKKRVIIYELDSTIAKQTISAMIEISYINYIIDKSGYIISGDRENPVTEKFEVTFRKDFERNSITKCPNCGANITGNKCDYCRSIVNDVEFKISNIKKIID